MMIYRVCPSLVLVAVNGIWHRLRLEMFDTETMKMNEKKMNDWTKRRLVIFETKLF